MGFAGALPILLSITGYPTTLVRRSGQAKSDRAAPPAPNCIFIRGQLFTFDYCPESRVALGQSPDKGSPAAFPSCHSRLRGNDNQLSQSFCSRASMMMPVFSMHMPMF